MTGPEMCGALLRTFDPYGSGPYTRRRASRASGHWAAFASLELLPAEPSVALLTGELQRDAAAMSHPDTPARERTILGLRQQLLRRRLAGLEPGDALQIPWVVHLIKTDPRTDDLPLLQYLCYRSMLSHCDGYGGTLLSYRGSCPTDRVHLKQPPAITQRTQKGLSIPNTGQGHGSAFLRLLTQRLIAEGGPLVAIDPEIRTLGREPMPGSNSGRPAFIRQPTETSR
jgi:hypothetical protein